jgi:hypothetical protein
MLEVVAVISTGVVFFLSMVLWANSGKFKSHNDH